MTTSKIVVEGATYALTHRCAFRKLFLTPLTPVIHEGLLFALGLALRETQTLLHHAVFMPNHPHLVVTSTEANLPRFKRLFYGEAGKFLKVALAEHGFEPPEHVFAQGAGHQMRLLNAAAQMTYLHYQDANTIKAGLVERVEHYPGVSTDLRLMNGATMTPRRPPFYFDRRHGTEVEIPLSAPPVAERYYGSSRDLVYTLRKARADKERQLASRRTRPVLGALAVTQQHPWNEPRSPRRFRQGPTPSFMVVADEELRIRCCVETTEIRGRYREARDARRRGEPAVFPYGTYAMRVFHNAPVEDAEHTAGRVVNAPGSLERRGETAVREDRRALNRALRRDANEVSEEDLDDTLAQRLEAATEETVDRREAPRELASVTEPVGRRPGSKLVVTRGSTRTARQRRREVQRARSSAPLRASSGAGSAEHPDPDPPPN